MPDLIQKVKGYYAAFLRGDIGPILTDLTDDVSWEVEGTPELKAAGMWRSPQGVAAYFAALAGEIAENKLEMTEFLANEDTVAAFGRAQAVVKATGIRFDTAAAHYIKFRDGKVARFVGYSNTAAVLEAIRGRAQGAGAS